MASQAAPAYFELNTNQVDHYAGQRYRDVLFHTPACWSNSFMFANDTVDGPRVPATASPAAMYISGNAVGVACRPAAGAALDVCGITVLRAPAVWPLDDVVTELDPYTTAGPFGSNGLAVNAARAAYNREGIATVAIDRTGTVRSTGVMLADGGMYDSRTYLAVPGVRVLGVDDSDSPTSVTLRIDNTTAAGAAAEDGLAVGARLLVGTQLYVVLARDVVAGELLLRVEIPAGPRSIALLPFAAQLVTLDILQDAPSAGATTAIGPLRNTRVQGSAGAYRVQFDDSPANGLCAELAALDAFNVGRDPQSPLRSLVSWGDEAAVVQVSDSAVCACGHANAPARSSVAVTSHDLPSVTNDVVLTPLLRAPVRPPAPLTDRGAAATYVGIARLLVLVGATNLLTALGGNEPDIVVNTATHGLQALWSVNAAGVMSAIVRVTTATLAGGGVLHITVEQEAMAFATGLDARSTLYAQLMGQPVRVLGSHQMDARHVELALYPSHITGPVARSLLHVAAVSPGCTVLLSDPLLPRDEAWVVERAPDAGGRFVLKSRRGTGTTPLGPRTVFLQTLMPLTSAAYAPASTCIGTGVPREALTVLGRGAFLDGIVLYAAPGQTGTTPATSLSVDDDGTLLVATSTTVRGQVTARSYKTVSDARLKRDIVPVDTRSALEDLLRINLHRYHFRDEFDGQVATHEPRMGVLAQELELVVPCAVSQTQEGTKVVDTQELLFRSVAAIQALTRRLELVERLHAYAAT